MAIPAAQHDALYGVLHFDTGTVGFVRSVQEAPNEVLLQAYVETAAACAAGKADHDRARILRGIVLDLMGGN